MEEGIGQDACNSDHTGLSAENGTSDSVVDPLGQSFSLIWDDRPGSCQASDSISDLADFCSIFKQSDRIA